MRQAAIYLSKAQQICQVGPTTQRVGAILAVACLFLGIVIAAFVPESLERRIGSLFFIGLIPAVGFYAVGHILSHLLVFSGKLLEMIGAYCFRCLALFVNDLVSRAGPSVSKELAKLSRRRQKAFCSVHRRYWRAHAAMFELSYRLIRSAARFAIRMQASQLEERPITYRRLPASRQWTRRPAAL